MKDKSLSSETCLRSSLFGLRFDFYRGLKLSFGIKTFLFELSDSGEPSDVGIFKVMCDGRASASVSKSFLIEDRISVFAYFVGDSFDFWSFESCDFLLGLNSFSGESFLEEFGVFVDCLLDLAGDGSRGCFVGDGSLGFFIGDGILCFFIGDGSLPKI